MNGLFRILCASSFLLCAAVYAEGEKVLKDKPTKKIENSSTKSSHWEKRMKNMTPEQKAAFKKKIAAVHSKLKGMSAAERKAYIAKLKEERLQRASKVKHAADKKN